jgi:DNA polymerase-3 subunit beta
MKFIVSTSALLKQLQSISGALAGNKVLPILDSFLFDIQKSDLTLCSSDLETSMVTTLEIECKENIKVAIEGKQLMDVLKNLTEQPLTFNIDAENYSVEINSDNGIYKLNGEDGDNFPKVPKQNGEAKPVTMAGATLYHIVASTSFAIGTEELRPAMTGLFFQLGTDGSSFVGTDAHRLVCVKRADINYHESASFIVPRKSILIVKNILPNDLTPVSISFDKNNAYFDCGKIQLVCRLIDAKYPDYEAVIPTENPNQLFIAKDDLLAALKRVCIFSNKTTNQVALKLKGSTLHIEGQDLDFSNEANESLVCNYNGADMEIGFNGKFLIDMLGAINAENIKLEMSTPSRAGIIVPENQPESEKLLMLIMPIMLSGNYD